MAEALLDPWTEERRKAPGYSILRIIDLERGVQEFRVLPPRRDDPEFTDRLLDGCTLVQRPEGMEIADLAGVIAEWDDVYRSQHSARLINGRCTECFAFHGEPRK